MDGSTRMSDMASSIGMGLPAKWLEKIPNNPVFGLAMQAAVYQLDAAQRYVLFIDALRQRGNQTQRAAREEAPTVLSFDAELIMDGRSLARPVNYNLFRINPPSGVEIDPAKRPFIVFDPRAGHGPGIGGMKKDSEIGAALKFGHPCYFVGFLPVPVPSQTIEDVCRAEAEFVSIVASLHPLALPLRRLSAIARQDGRL